MDYGWIIKRSWQITWRYKALWVLGLFAGISGGCQGGGSGGSNYRTGGDSGTGGFDTDFLSDIERWLPILLVTAVVLAVLLILWSILSVAARGGLVVAVNEIEQVGRARSLGELWGVGFSRFWTLVGLGILLQLPVFAVLLIVLVGALAPIVGTVIGGGEPGPEAFVPICGFLGIGIPVLIVLGFVLGIVYLIAVRYVMLAGNGAIESAGNAWRLFRARFKDTALMYLINAGLNIAAGFVLAIPAVLIGIAIAVPLAGGLMTGSWEVMAVPIVVGVLVIIALSWLYTAIWGTYTSSLWTLFFRRVTGMDVVPVAMPAPAPAPGYGYPQQPQAPQQPYAPTPPPPGAEL